MISPMTVSVQDLITNNRDVLDFAILAILEVFTGSLSYGPFLVLSIAALHHLRKRRSSPCSRSSNWLSVIILSQAFFVTLRTACSVGIFILNFKDSQYIVLDDGSIQVLYDAFLANIELGLGCVAAMSARAVEVLASAVLVWRAWTLYSELFWIRHIVTFLWAMDFAVEVFYLGTYIEMNIIKHTVTGKSPASSEHLSRIALYASRWTSFALNGLVTLIIAYRAWKFKHGLKNAGLGTKKSMVYHILARLVETGVILLAVQLLVAVLATTYTSVDSAAPKYIAMTVLAEVALFIINAHPAAMSLVSANIVSKENRGSTDVESAGDSGNIVFRVTETGLSTERPISSVASIHKEK